jgi:hypothetical protein
MNAGILLRAGLVVGFFLSPILAFQGGELERSQVWFNLPTSPAKIERSPNGRFITLNNYSSKQMVKYQLGCVVSTTARIKVLHRFNEEADSIEPVDISTNQLSFILLHPTWKSVKKCTDRSAKLAVVRVGFTDGSGWRIDR